MIRWWIITQIDRFVGWWLRMNNDRVDRDHWRNP